ncbi:MAG TPA: tetratricopeptide repeat protein [Bacteroidales bacterium]|nr:tetratricopeptide repeat protein [Bacteroidales bacterium]
MLKLIRYHVLLAAIVLALLFINTTNAQFNKAYFFYKGEELISRGNYAEAIPVLNTLLNVDSTIHEAWFLRGVARYYQNDLIGAGDDFSKCLNINPLFSQAYQYKAMVLQQLGKSAESIEYINKALELRPASAQYLFTYGVILFQQEQYHDALNAFNQVLRIDDRIPDAWLNRGTARLMLSDSSGALTDYTAAINLNPFNANPYVRRGALYAQQSNYSLALQDLNQAIGIDSTLAQAYFTRALVYYYQKQMNQALTDLNKVLQYESRNTLALFNRAIINYEIGNAEAAIDDLTRLSSIIPTNVLVHYYLASIRFERGYLPTALKNINKAIDIFPQFAKAYLLRAEIKSKKGDLEGAEADIAQGNRLAQEYRSKAGNDINSIMDSAGKLKRLLSLDEELDITSSISMEQLRSRILTIIYPIITLKIDAAQNVKPRNWQSSSLRQMLASASCNGYTLYFDYDSIDQQLKPKTINADSLPGFCTALLNLQRNQYTLAMGKLTEMVNTDSTNTLVRLAETLARIRMTQFVESVRSKTLLSGSKNSVHGQNINESFTLAANDLKEIAKVNDFEGIVPYNIGVILMHTENNDLANEWFSKAISCNPLIHGAWYNRGLLYLISNETVKGCSDLRKAVNLGNNQASEVIARFCKK